MIFESVRSELLNEALNSPNLLFELANLEKYIAETYSSRVFVELLQNADDAQAKNFLVQIADDYIICANDGDIFSYSNFYSLCRNASSDKSRGSSIGYRGIGFKSVAEVATEAHLISGEINVTFSKILTAQVLNTNSNVPLIRIPHYSTINSNSSFYHQINDIFQQGYSTIFIFTGINKDKIIDEFHLFDSGFLLFLHNIECVKLEYGQNNKKYKCNRIFSSLENAYIHNIISANQTESWQVYSNSNCSLAVSLINNQMVELIPDNALVHAFLPTQEQTGMSIRVNADFSTDPSRTRIVLDEQTYYCINSLCDLLNSICRAKLKTNQLQNFLKVITPNIEMSTIKMQKKSFKTEFILELQKHLTFINAFIAIVPTWFNSVDAESIFKKKAIVQYTEDDLFINFLRFINIKPINLEDIINYLKTGNSLSRIGNIQLITYILKHIALIKNKYNIKNLNILENNKGLIMNAYELSSSEYDLSKEFLAELAEKVNLNEFGIVFFDNNSKFEKEVGEHNKNNPHFIAAFHNEINNHSSNDILQQDKNTVDLVLKNAIFNSEKQKIKNSNLLSEWRSAELYLSDLLANQGYNVEDRSRQNLGYDLFATKDNAEYFFEVKLLDAIGKPFIITSNEEAVARTNKEKYIIALIIKKPNEVMISFVHDPVKNLSFIRQCRQWVWECSEYNFNPIVFAL